MPPRNSIWPKRRRDGSRGSNARIGRARTSMTTGGSARRAVCGSARSGIAPGRNAAAANAAALLRSLRLVPSRAGSAATLTALPLTVNPIVMRSLLGEHPRTRPVAVVRSFPIDLSRYGWRRPPPCLEGL